VPVWDLNGPGVHPEWGPNGDGVAPVCTSGSEIDIGRPKIESIMKVVASRSA
jgi:hypothetical protein